MTDVGCNEGLMNYTSVFAEKNAVWTEGNYLYTAQDGTCNSSGCRVDIPHGGVVWSIDVSNDNNSALKATRVHRHRGRPVLVSVVLFWRAHDVSTTVFWPSGTEQMVALSTGR